VKRSSAARLRHWVLGCRVRKILLVTGSIYAQVANRGANPVPKTFIREPSVRTLIGISKGDHARN
jgi:hypothetical protein